MTPTESRFDASPEARPHGSERESRLDAVFDALASRMCRALLGHLADADDPLGVDDLAARVGDDVRVGDDARTRARLHHTYLPKLDDAGLVEYDRDRDLVRAWSDTGAERLHDAVAAAADADLSVDLDTLFDLLSNARRRRALRILVDHGDLSLPDLADEVAVAERGQPLSAIDPDAVLQVYLSLYHTHVPKLTDAGVAVYDQNGDHVALTDAGEPVEATVRGLCEAAAP